MTSAPVVAAWRKRLRDGFAMALPLARKPGRCGLYRFADSLVRSATAQVAAHRRVDIRVARVRILREQRDRRHDLSGLAIAALHDVLLDPRGLHRVGDAIAFQPLD